jgi:hypothetical protein
MASYTCMYKRNQKGIKMRMETSIGLYDNGNEIISWHSLCVRSIPCIEWQMSLHALSLSKHIALDLYKLDNDNVPHGSKIVFGDDNIHLSLCVVGKR